MTLACPKLYDYGYSTFRAKSSALKRSQQNDHIPPSLKTPVLYRHLKELARYPDGLNNRLGERSPFFKI